ncbi:hypothetical protein E4T80_07575 [Muribacter muris]|uniref:Uncharacterized protein n=1 Tax=Muribacter muris TaxID=67855 RepID=A0A4Y9JVB6_9PAST|nr:hypothetical protein E4T80_07575 [Muribacter muris]
MLIKNSVLHAVVSRLFFANNKATHKGGVALF